MRMNIDDIRARAVAWRQTRKEPRLVTNASQAAYDREALLRVIDALLDDSGMACEEPCLTCAGCLYAAERAERGEV